MKVAVKITVDKNLRDKARRMGLNISDYVNTSLGTFLKGIPDELIKQYAALTKQQGREVNQKLLKITKELFGGETKK